MSRVGYKRQRDNLLYENLLYTGDFGQPVVYDFVWYDGAGYSRRSTGDVDELVSYIREDGVNWVSVRGLSDLVSLERLFLFFDIDRLWMQDIVNVRHIAKIDVAEGDVLAVLDYFWRDGGVSGGGLLREHLAILVRGNVVVTFQESPVSRFLSIERAMDNEGLRVRRGDAGFLFNLLLSSVVDGYLLELDYQREGLLEVESVLLSDDTDDGIGRRLQQLRRDFLSLRKSVLPFRGELAHLRESSVYSEENGLYFTDTHDHLEQVYQMVDSEQALISSLYDFFVTTNDQRLNRVVGRLTVLSAVFIPLTFMAGVWGMNFSAMPELSMRWGYPLALLSMLVVAIGVVVYFKYKKWL